MKPRQLSLILLAGSLVLTAILWIVGMPFFFLFLFITVIPFLSRARKMQHCPVCGWETAGNERFCPIDASPLQRDANNDKERSER